MAFEINVAKLYYKRFILNKKKTHYILYCIYYIELKLLGDLKMYCTFDK